MTQTGDPTGKGKGGESIWGGKVRRLTHRIYLGPNGSSDLRRNYK